MQHLETAFAALVVGPECRVEVVGEDARNLKNRGKYRDGDDERLMEKRANALFCVALMRLERPPEYHARERQFYNKSKEPIFAADKWEEDGIHNDNDGEDGDIEIPLGDALK